MDRFRTGPFKSSRVNRRPGRLRTLPRKSVGLAKIRIGAKQGVDVVGHAGFKRAAVTPTVFQQKPFGKHVEGLLRYMNESCSFEIVFK